MEFSSLILYFLLLVFLMLFSAFFSGSETAMSALTRASGPEDAKGSQKKQRRRGPFLDNPRRLFITVLFGNTLVNMAFISIMGALIYDELFKGRNLGMAYVAAIFY